MELKVGHIVRLPQREGIDPVTQQPYLIVKREIIEVRETGYSWRYPDLGELTEGGVANEFRSENSSDPFFDRGWSLVS